MKYFDWDTRKNDKLKIEREIGFENILIAIEEGGLLDITGHPNQKRYPRQQIFVVKVYDYAYLVPFVEDDKKIFLKTIIPSRKATQKYLIKNRKK